MKQLLYKEFKLAINPLFCLIALTSFLVLIPSWPYFIAPMYFFFITAPNLFGLFKSNEDVRFSVMLPVRKRDVVKARFASIILLELLQIAVVVIAALIYHSIYTGHTNFFFNLNVAFFGFLFVIFGLFNIAFFPMYYKTAYKMGASTVVGMIVALAAMVVVEALVYIPGLQFLNSMEDLLLQIPVLIGGIIVFALLNFIAFRVSAKRFERVDL